MKVHKNTRITRWYSKYWNSGGTNLVPLCPNFFLCKLKVKAPKIDFGTGHEDIGQKL